MTRTWGEVTPRRWQSEALPLALESLDGEKPGVIRACTGSGKSILQAELARRIVHQIEPGSIMLVTAPTQDLVRQLSKTFYWRNPNKVGRFYQYEKRTDTPIVVACHASMTELAAQLERENKRVLFWIADECHKTESPQVLGFSEAIPVERRIGFTATPFRRLERERLSLFDELLYDYGPQEAIRDGVIVPPRVIGYEGESEDMDQVCLELVHEAVTHGPGIVNAWNTEDADQYAELLRESGIRAASIHSKQKKKIQKELLDRLESGDLHCLVHVNLLAEGVDLPWLRWLVMRRASESQRGSSKLRVISRVRFIQEVGRIVRSHPGKSEALIYDPNDLFGTLALDYDALLGETEEEETDDQTEFVAREVTRNVNLSGPIEDQRLQVVEQRSPIQQYVRQVSLTMRLLGFSNLKSTGQTKWRHYPATSRQKTMAQRLMKDVTPYVEGMPVNHRSSLRAACLAYKQGLLNQGDMFDLNTIMMVMVKQSGWPLNQVDQGDLDNANS